MYVAEQRHYLDGPVVLLSALAFSDLYVDDGMERGFILSRPGEVPEPLPRDCWDDAYGLVDRMQQQAGKREFGLAYGGIRYRVSQVPNVPRKWWHCRRIPPRVWSWDELRLPPRLQAMLLEAGRDDGAVIFGGKTGEGKTWSAGATALNWADKVGGVCVAIESPIELPLAGRRERGEVFQRDVAEYDFADELVSCLRITPRFLFLGEIRRPAAARELLQAATNGHPILSTLHCGSVVDGLMRLADLATEPGIVGGRKAAFELLAQGLSVFVHQRLIKSDGEWLPRFEVLHAGPSASDPVRVLIREGKLPELSTHIVNHTRAIND